MYNHQEYIEANKKIDFFAKNTNEPEYEKYRSYMGRRVKKLYRFKYKGKIYDGFTLNEAKRHWKFLTDNTKQIVAVVNCRIQLIYPDIKKGDDCLVILQPSSQWPMSKFMNFLNIDITDELTSFVPLEKPQLLYSCSSKIK